MKCTNCNHENIEGALFCQECGTSLVNQTADVSATPNKQEEQEVSNSTEMIDVPSSTEVIDISSSNEMIDAPSSTKAIDAPTTDEVIEPSLVKSFPTADVEEEKKKKSKVPMIIIIAIILIGLIGLAVTFGKTLIKSDEDKLIDAIHKTQMAKQKAVVGEFGFNEFSIDGIGVMEAAVVENLIKGITIEYKLLSDTETRQVESTVGIVMNGSELINVTLDMNEEYVAIGVPALYKDVIYLNWKDVNSLLVKYDLVEEDEMPELNVDRMIELIDAYSKSLDFKQYEAYKNIDQAKYNDLVYGYLGESIVDVSKGSLDMDIVSEELSLSGQLYTLDINMEEYMGMSTKLMTALLEDENILPMIIEGATKVIDTTIEQEDVYVYNIAANLEGDSFINEWNPSFEKELIDLRDEFIKNAEDEYAKMVDEAKDSLADDDYLDMQKAIADIYSEIDMESKLLVSKDYVMGSESTITIDDSIIDAIRDSEALMDAGGYMMYQLEELDVLFKVSIYSRSGVLQINETINFEGLPSSAIDFASLDEMDLMEIYQEIMMNVEKLSSSFSTGF